MVDLNRIQPAPGQVVQVWTKGRAFPLFIGAVMLLLTAGLAVLAVKQGLRAGLSDFGPTMIITLAWSAMALTVALRRKATLTTSHLILRSFFGTRVIPLGEITAIHKTWTWGKQSNGFIADLVSDLITETFFTRVKFEVPKDRTTTTRAIGRVPDEGMATIREVAKRAGGPIYSDRAAVAESSGPSETTDPTDAPAEPSKYSPGLLRLIKIARVTRDLLIMAGGVTLIVIGFVHVPHTADFNYAWIFGLILFVGFGVGALFHTLPYDRDWRWWQRLLGCLVGIGLGGLCLVYALGGSGLLGQRADATLTNCAPTTHYTVGRGGSTSTHVETDCDALVHWPDGSQETIGISGKKQGTVLNFVKPNRATSWLVDDGPTTPWPDTLAFGFTGALMILQAIYSIMVLIVGRLLRLFWPRQSTTDLPPGRLPV